MTDPNTMIGIDIGTHAIKIVIAEVLPSQPMPRILHAIESPSRGFRHGYIVDAERASDSFSKALHKAEQELGTKISKARFSVGGVGLTSQYVRTSIERGRGHGEITERDVEEVVAKSEHLFTAKYQNKKILHIIPVKYRVDGRDVLGAPVGMYGSSIEVKVIFITTLEHHYDSFVSLIEKNGVSITDIIASPIADAAISLSYKQKTQGAMVCNIGSETTSLTTFENGTITSLDILSIGSNDITNDIALVLQIPLEEADAIKCGSKHSYPKRQVEEIIHARLADMLELAGRHLQKIKKNRLLPAGIIFTGGGSHVEHINDYAKQELKLPSEELTLSQISKKTKRTVRIPNQFSIAYGLCISEAGRQDFSSSFLSFKKIKQTINYWISQLMP